MIRARLLIGRIAIVGFVSATRYFLIGRRVSDVPASLSGRRRQAGRTRFPRPCRSLKRVLKRIRGSSNWGHLEISRAGRAWHGRASSPAPRTTFSSRSVLFLLALLPPPSSSAWSCTSARGLYKSRRKSSELAELCLSSASATTTSDSPRLTLLASPLRAHPFLPPSQAPRIPQWSTSRAWRLPIA